MSSSEYSGKLSKGKCEVYDTAATAEVAQLVERPELRFLKEVQLSDVSSNPGRGIRW